MKSSLVTLQRSSQQEAEERNGMIELHLFVVECKSEEDAAHDVVPSDGEHNSPQEQTETGTVILKMAVINEKQRR